MHGAFAVAPEDENDGNTVPPVATEDSTVPVDAVSATRGKAVNKVLRQQAGTVEPYCTHGRGATGYSATVGDASWSGYVLFLVVLGLAFYSHFA